MATQQTPKKKKGIRIKSLVILAIVLVAALAVLFVVYKIKGPTHNMENLEKYFFLTENPDVGRQAAGENELAVVLEDRMLDQNTSIGETEEEQITFATRAIRQDDRIYLSYGLVNNLIDERFYWDSNEKVAVVTNANDIVMARLNENCYTRNGEPNAIDYPAVIEYGSSVYFAVDFIRQFSHAEFFAFSDPARVYIKLNTGVKKLGEVKGKTPLRIKAGIRANVVIDLKKGETVQIINDNEEEIGNWYEVINEEGFVGYVQSRNIKNVREEEAVSTYAEPEYTRLTMDGKINCVWKAIYSDAANDFNGDMQSVTGVNIISPTWYSIINTNGDIAMRSDTDFVNAAHNSGCKVWALLDVDSYYNDVSSRDVTRQVLTHTSIRQAVIGSLMNDVISRGVDGINVDIELVNSDFSNDYIEFIRELSVEMRKAGKVLSVDVYTPYEYNAKTFHLAELGRLSDYVVVMGYDDYVGTGKPGPNASLPFVRESVEMALKYVSADRLIYGIPFYTRIWYQEGGEDGPLTREELDMNNAQITAQSHGELTWDEELGYNSITYQNYGTTVYIWLEDEQSIDAKCRLYSENGIAGVAGWSLGMERSSIWSVISQYY